MANGRRGWRAAGVVGLACAALTVGGCNALGFVAMSVDRATPRKVEAQYRGLEGKNFAVVVTADRMTQADFPGVVPKVLTDLSERLAAENKVGAAGYVPPDRVLAYLYAHPNWVVRPMADVARDLDPTIERLVFVELSEYRLNEPGNAHLWAGVAAGMVQVYEIDSALPDDPAFDRAVQVRFPDDQSVSELQLPGSAVGTELVRRFVDRAAWLFLYHEEPKDLKY